MPPLSTRTNLLSLDPPSGKAELITYLDDLHKAYADLHAQEGETAAEVLMICTHIKQWKAVLQGGKHSQPTERDMANIYTFLAKLKAEPLKVPEYRRGKGFAQ